MISLNNAKNIENGKISSINIFANIVLKEYYQLCYFLFDLCFLGVYWSLVTYLTRKGPRNTS